MFLPLLTALLAVWQPLIANTEVWFDECAMPATCSGITNDRNPGDIRESERGLCFCDPDCSIVKDCCIDAVLNETPRLMDIAPAYWECRELTVQDRSHEMIYMVSSCPNGHFLQDQCSQTSMDYDYKLDIPVLSSRTGIWFKNIFCAICHNYTEHFRALDLFFSCNGENTTLQEVLTLGTYLPGELTWFYEDSVCVLQAQLHASDTMNTAEPWERPCIPAVSSCPQDWENTTVAKFCQSYALYVESRGETQVYKNPHCALCSGLDIEELSCHDSSSTSMRNVEEAVIRPPPSLRLIMDFTWYMESKSCHPPAGVWDVLHARCEILDSSCSQQMENQRSRCVQTISSSRPTQNDSSNETCSRIILNPGEFTLHGDGYLKVLIPRSSYFGYLFPPGKYTLMSGGRSEVCDMFQTNLARMDLIQGYLTIICLSISLICLTLHLIISKPFLKQKNLHGKNLQALSGTLLVAQLAFLVGVNPIISVPQETCIAFAAVLYFGYLSAFLWMNIISVDIWRTFSASVGCIRNSATTHYKYAMFAWGIPAIMTSFALVANYTSLLPRYLRPEFGSGGTCWFGNENGLAVFFVTPVSLILFINLILFLRTIYELHRKQENRRYIESIQAENVRGTRRRVGRTSSDYIRFCMLMKLFTIMGLGWIMGILAVFLDQPILWYPYIALNGLQGTFIFFMSNIKRNTLITLWRRVVHHPEPQVSNTQRNAGGGSTSSNSSTRTSMI